MQTYLKSLANKLNSRENFNKNTNFETELTLVCTPPSGSGRGKERFVGRRNVEAFLKAKHSVIQIKNTDELCCAQAIVTMKACLHKGDNVDGRHLYENLRDGYPVQGVQARTPSFGWCSRRTVWTTRIGNVSESFESRVPDCCLNCR